MDLIKRNIYEYVQTAAKEYPVIVVVGPRQSGKTTLAKMIFGDKPYFSLENPDVRSEIEDDPRGFLSLIQDGAVIDEFQRIPELTSYLQQVVDEDQRPGRFILTGSRSLEIMDKVSQSLVGRAATIELLPFSYSEINEYDTDAGIEDFLLKGFYPPIYHKTLTPSIWVGNYVRNYLERDVRQMLNVKDLNVFQRFLVLCAGRIGSLINYSDLSSELGVSHNTIKSWFSILSASYIVFFLQPYFTNFSKRVVKTPKLYFYDTGLASWLLSVKELAHLKAHPLRGALFENFCVSELMKNRFNSGERSNLYFWRDKSGHEIDVIIDEGSTYKGIEIKSSMTYNKAFLKNLDYLSERDKNLNQKYIIWGSDQSEKSVNHERISWRHIDRL